MNLLSFSSGVPPRFLRLKCFKKFANNMEVYLSLIYMYIKYILNNKYS